MRLENKLAVINRIHEMFVVVIYLAMTMVVLFNVFNRNILKLTVGWPDELSRYFMVWLVYITVPICFARDKHFKLSLLTTFVFKAENRIHQVMVLAVTAAYSVVFFWATVEICTILYDNWQRSTGMGIPMWIVYAILPTCFLLILLQMVIKLAITLKGVQAESEKKT